MNIVACFVFFFSDTNVYSGLNILLVKVSFVILKQFFVYYSFNIVSFKKTTVIKRTTVAVERKAKWPLKVGKCM